ncbi:MAG: alpha/beta fold hydrolase [Pseudomonadota bacterium]
MDNALRAVFRWILRGLGGLLVLLVLLVGGMWLFGPVEPVERGAPFTEDIGDPDAYLAAREAAFDDITPGTEARIVWAGESGATTDLVLVYLHGFSATSEEIRPVPDRVAEALGANLLYTRLTGHGRGGEALASASAGAWIDDAAEALAIASAIGERVVVIGTSTGATLAAVAATEPDLAPQIDAVAMISPNFELANPAGRILSWPGARIWAPWIAGPERAFETVNDGHERFWTTRYPTVSVLPMAALMQEVAARDVSGVNIPLMVIFSEDDRVISPPAARAFALRWGGEVEVSVQDLPAEGADPYAHVIAGDILSPAMTEPVTAELTDWIRATLP